MSTLNVTNISDGTNSTATTNVVKGSAKAWVNFNGTGTVAIREDYNVSSITDHGTGIYSVNFSTAMPDANYSAVIFCSNDGAVRIWAQMDGLNNSNFGRYLTTSVSFYIGSVSDIRDTPFVNVSIFR